MRLFVQHRTEYRFSEPQARLIQLLRLTPGNHAGQSVIAWSIDVDRDARLKPGRDGYGNETTMLYVDGPLDRIVLTVSGEVLTDDRAGMIELPAEPLPPLYFLQPTAPTAADQAVRDWVEEAALPDDRLAGAHRLSDALHQRLEPGARCRRRSSCWRAAGRGAGGCTGLRARADRGGAACRLSGALRRRLPQPS